MINKLIDIEIPDNHPFLNDKLDRKDCASTFISLTNRYAEYGCVIALCGDWGSGKTTFVKMTMQEMKNRGSHPLYFNTWENDYVSDPLIALLSEIKEINPSSDKWNEVIANAGKIVTGIFSSLLKGFIKMHLGLDSNSLSAAIDESTNIIKKDLDDYANQKKTFEDFKDSLKKYIVENTEEGKPVVFFVDELDRCNPHFAVKVLERIKHLFDIPNIVFVLSINKTQMEYAIQGYYGSNNIDASNYLRRFIDVEFSLPQPDSNKYCKFLYDYYDFNKVFKNIERLKCNDLRYEEGNFKEIVSILIGNSNLDLRTIDKIFSQTRLGLDSFENDSYIFPEVYFILCYLKVIDSKFYNKIASHEYKAQDLLTELEEKFSTIMLFNRKPYQRTARQMTFNILSLLHMYDIDTTGNPIENVFELKKVDKQLLKANKIELTLFDEAYQWECNHHSNHDTPLYYLIKKINLHDSFCNSN